MSLTLVQELEKWIDCPAAWDGGPKKVFRWSIDGKPQRDTKGLFVRVGSWGANTWFHVAVGKTEKTTLGNVRRRLGFSMRRFGIQGTFRYE